MARRANGEGNIRKRSDGRWEARYYDPRESDPKKQRKSIVKRTQKETKDALQDVLNQIKEWEQNPQEISVIKRNDITLKEWLEKWMKTYMITKVRDSTYASYEGYINTAINPLIGNKRVQALTGMDIQAFYTKLQAPKEIGGRGLSGATIRKIKNIISGALKQAIVNQIIKENPVNHAIAPRIEDANIRILSPEEQKLFSSVLEFYNTGNMFAFDLACGARIGELCALEESDINREEKYITISKTVSRVKDKYTGIVDLKVRDPKTKHSKRRIPLLPSMEVILDRQKKLVEKMKAYAKDKWIENNLVFPTNTGRTHDLSGLRSSIKRIAKRVGIDYITLHALRHTYITTALNSGVSAQNVARLVGHKDGATTLKYYAHYLKSEAISQLENMESSNISNYAISENELSNIIQSGSKPENFVLNRINEAISKTKFYSKIKSANHIITVCEEILVESIDSLSREEKDTLLMILSKYLKIKKASEKAA